MAAEPEALRVEELARRSDTSVDTIRFYQKRGLLPPPRREGRVAWYGADHLERLLRIRELQGQGFSLAMIRRLLDGELDAADEPLAAAVAAASDEELLSLDELAARAGVPSPLLQAVVREGLLVARVQDGEPRFAASDVAIVAAGLQLLEAGLPLAELLALAQRHDAATRAIAEHAVTLFDVHVREPLRASDLTADERAERLVEAFRTLLPTVTTLVEHHFRSVLLQVAREHLESVGEPAELDAASAEPDWGGEAREASS
jgi:DNA-binding transcriptional MerR regulator